MTFLLLPRYPKWTAFIAEHPGSWSKLTKCPTETVYKDGKGRERGCTRFKFGVMDAVRGRNLLSDGLCHRLALLSAALPCYTRFPRVFSRHFDLTLTGSILTTSNKAPCY